MRLLKYFKFLICIIGFLLVANTAYSLENLLHARGAIGPGGNIKTTKYFYGDNFPIMQVSDTCVMENQYFKTINMNHSTTGGYTFQFQCPENTFKEINDAYSPLNDAHYFSDLVFAMYDEWYGLQPINIKLPVRVHYGFEFENAFWDGTSVSFGDGKDILFPLTNLDIVSHEISHGFTEENSSLKYANQSGGINESFSDISGEVAIYYSNKDKPENERNFYLFGADTIKVGTAIRYFKDPTLDSVSIDHVDDYYDGIDVHYSSGIFNKGFYTLANLQDWNPQKAFDIFVLANQIYWTQNATFNEALCGIAYAAMDLEYNVVDVIDAFKVVGVQPNCIMIPPGPEEIPVPGSLPSTSPITVSGNIGSEKFWIVVIPNDSLPMLRITVNGGTGDVDLYVLKDSEPTLDRWHCRPYEFGNEETCTFKNPKAGEYNIMLRGYAAYDNITLTAYY